MPTDTKQNLVRSDADAVILKRIYDLADEIYALACPLDRPQHRNHISDAARLIQWLVADVQDHSDPETQDAIKTLAEALAKVKLTGPTKLYAD